MGRAWHLSRGNEKHGPISDRELLLLAELGQVLPDDLLWRPGFDGWKAANCIPGVLSPPPVPSNALAGFRLMLDKIRHRLVARWGELPTRARDWTGSIQLWARDVSKQAKLDRRSFARSLQNPPILAGLALAVVGMCALDVIRYSSFAMSSEAAPQGLDVAEITPNSTPADAAFYLPSEQLLLGTTANVQQVHDTPEVSEVIAPIQDIVDDASVVAPSSSVAQPSIAIPMPTKKPAKPIVKVSAAPRTKPMHFGTIGFNYSD